MRGLFRWSSKWWPGAIPLVIFWGFAAWTTTVPLEADLAQRATAALKDTVLDKTADRGRRARRHVRAPKRSPKKAAAARWRRSKPCRACGWSMTTPAWSPRPSPSSGRPSATWSGSRWRQRAAAGQQGQAAGCGARAVSAASRSPTAWHSSRGAPPRFDAAALLLLDQIGKLKDGKITLTDTKVSLSGMARELGGREAIAAALKNLPEGFSVAANEVKAPPYVFQANKDPVAVDADADRLCARQ